MQIQVVKSKIHRVKVTGADLQYIGSVTIDEDLMDAANIIQGEKVQIVNINNGERLETYAIPGPRKSGEITLNGPAARKVAKGDIIIIISYGLLDFEEAKSFKPWLIFPNENDNTLTKFEKQPKKNKFYNTPNSIGSIFDLVLIVAINTERYYFH